MDVSWTAPGQPALTACWLSRPDFVPWLDYWVCQTETRPTPAAALLGHLTASDEYWSTHWTFRSGRFPKAQPLLGVGRLHDIAVNVILPWLYARASADDNTGLAPAGGGALLRVAEGAGQLTPTIRPAAVALCDDCVFPDLVHRHSLEKR